MNRIFFLAKFSAVSLMIACSGAVGPKEKSSTQAAPKNLPAVSPAAASPGTTSSPSSPGAATAPSAPSAVPPASGSPYSLSLTPFCHTSGGGWSSDATGNLDMLPVIEDVPAGHLKAFIGLAKIYSIGDGQMCGAQPGDPTVDTVSIAVASPVRFPIAVMTNITPAALADLRTKGDCLSITICDDSSGKPKCDNTLTSTPGSEMGDTRVAFDDLAAGSASVSVSMRSDRYCPESNIYSKCCSTGFYRQGTQCMEMNVTIGVPAKSTPVDQACLDAQ